MARPASSYSDKLARRICDLIAEGQSLETISAKVNMPSRRLMRGWLEDHPDFARRYEIARRERTDSLVDEAISIADSVRGTDSNAEVGAAKLAVDTRRWLASKLLPERFGDQLAITGKGGTPLLPAAEPEPGKVALAILSLLSRAGGPDADPQPVIEHEAAEQPAIKLTLDPVPDPQPTPSRTLLVTPAYDEELARREASLAREGVRLKVVQLYGGIDQQQPNTRRGRDD